MIVMLNNNFQYAREELEMTQEELGYVFGVHKSTISGWENGYSIIPFKKLVKFCNMYDFSLDFVCGLSRRNTNYSKINTDKKYIGKRLKETRKKIGLTQKQVAEECSISQTTYSTYESGLYLVSTMTLYTVCKNHKLSMDMVLGRKESK